MINHQNKPSNIIIFDRELIRLRRERAALNFNEHDFLFSWSKDQLKGRLDDINRTFPNVLQLGSRGALLPQDHDKTGQIFTCDLARRSITPNLQNYFQASEELLPITPTSMDMVISNLNLHTVNDLPGALLQIRNCLKDDGLFIASMLGGETLHELRNVMTEVELELMGGASPRIAPFADKRQMGDLLARAGLALPVTDSDIITVTYDNIFKLFHDLRGMGESNAILARNKTPLTREFFMRAAQLYQERYAQEDGRIIASFEVIFLLGWAPHESQQKPLAPGSAKHRLADALNNTLPKEDTNS